MSPRRRHEWITAGAALLLALSVYAPFAWNAALPSAPHSDVTFATQNARGFVEGLAEGVLIPRWLADANRGHGSPMFLYYPPGAYYLVAVANALAPDLLSALRAAGIALALLSGATCFLAARRWASPAAAAFAAALYVALPYHVLDLYERFALAELAAFVWLPPVFAFADRLLESPSRRAWLGLTASYGALVITHLMSAFIIAFVLVPFLALRVGRSRRWRRLVPFASAIGAGLACAGFFLVPVLLERGLVQLELASELERFDWRRNLLFRDEVALGYTRSTVKPLVERAVAAQTLAMLGALATLAWRRHRAPDETGAADSDTATTRAWGATAVWALLLQTPITAPLWTAAPELPGVQFPWRFAGLQALAVAVLAARAFDTGRATGAARLQSLPAILGACAAVGVSLGIAAQARHDFDLERASWPGARAKVEYWVVPRGVPDALALSDEPLVLAPRVGLSQPGRVEVMRWDPHERRLVYESDSDGALRLRTFAFAGWRAWLDDDLVPVRAAGRWRSLEVDAPAGRHEVRLVFGATPPRRAGASLSIAGVMLWLVVAAWGRWRPSPRAAVRTGSTALLLGVTACSPADAPHARHLVILTLDTVRRDHLSVYGYERPTTPRLEAFARGAVVFWNAVAQDTNTSPSHASMLTGKYPHVHGSRANGQRLAAGVSTLADILHEAGFATGGFVSSAVLSANASGLDRGFEVYDDAFPTRRRTGEATVERALDWLDRQPEDSRRLLFVHLYDAHGPYRPPPLHAERFRSPTRHGELPRVPRHMRMRDAAGRPFASLSQYTDLYDATLRHVDDLFGLLRRGLDLRDTALIVLADHGETLGERAHGLDHGGQVFDEQVRIPLVVSVPGVAHRRVDTPVETVDLLPTALELLGVAAPEGVALQGRSLVPLLTGDARSGPDPRPVFSAARAVSARHADRGYDLDSRRRIQAVRFRGWKLIRYPGVEADAIELYDLRADPGETRNVAGREPERTAEYLALLDAWSGDDDAGEVELEPALREQLRELGYLEPIEATDGPGGSAGPDELEAPEPLERGDGAPAGAGPGSSSPP